MNTVAPPLAAPASAPASTPASVPAGAGPAPVGLAGSLANPPMAVRALALGSLLQGVVQGLDGKGHTLVRTDLGMLLVSTQAKLAPGSRVTLQVRAAGSRLHVAILRVDGQPAQAGRAPAQPGGAQAARSAPDATGAAGDRLSLGQTLRATVLSSPTGPTVAGSGVAGSGVGGSGVGGSGVGGSGVGSSGVGGFQGATPSAPVGSEIAVRLLHIMPPGETPASTPPGAHSTTSGAPNSFVPAAAIPATAAGAPPGSAGLRGVVIGATAAGQPVIETARGVLALKITAEIPVGSAVLLEVADRPAPAVPRPIAAGSTLIHAWPALEEVLELWRGSQAAASQSAAAAPNLPQAGPKLASGILFFLSALAGGNLAGWLGPAVLEALERAGRGDLLARLAGDFAQLANLSDAAGGDWRFLPIPLVGLDQVQQLRLFLRHRQSGGGAEGEEPEEASRFVLEVDMSRIGELQLDGMVRPRRFDLILRSRAPLAPALRHDIMAIFEDANSAAGNGGQMIFQATADWSFLPLAPETDAGTGLVV